MGRGELLFPLGNFLAQGLVLGIGFQLFLQLGKQWLNDRNLFLHLLERFLGGQFLFLTNYRNFILAALFAIVSPVRSRRHNLPGGQHALENILILFKNHLNQAVRTGSPVEHRTIVAIASWCTGLTESLAVLTDIPSQIVIKKVAEESQHSWFAKRIISEHPGNFPLRISSGAHAPIGNGLAQFFIRLDVTQRVINGQSEFPILQHDPSVGIGFPFIHQLRTEQRVTMQEDCGQAHEDAVFLADLGDGILYDLKVVAGLRGSGRPERQSLKKIIHG